MSMDPSRAPAMASPAADSEPSITQLLRRPRTMAETGLRETLLDELVLKHLYDGGVSDLGHLIKRICLPGAVLEQVLNGLRAAGEVEARGKSGEGVGLRYALTERGRATALDALTRSGYIGPAPVPLALYEQVVALQSVHRTVVSRAAMRSAFSDVVIQPRLLDQLGPALHSGRAIFIYGPPGTGKSYISRRLTRLLHGPILVPRALVIGDTIVAIFDPTLHRPVATDEKRHDLMLERGLDERFLACDRPVAITGGELTIDMLELRYDATKQVYEAPFQLKATNGMLIIDDFGRQRVTPIELMNRWIVPMEEGRDSLTIQGGQSFWVPFDLVLVFSTNMNPLDLADEAFLRRIGYKIHFPTLSVADYTHLWRQICAERGVAYDAAMIQFLIEELHLAQEVPLLPCHPRDFLGLVLDHCRYQDVPIRLTEDHLRWAWQNYFVHWT
jgi:predicted ATPase with chaperone activity